MSDDHDLSELSQIFLPELYELYCTIRNDKKFRREHKISGDDLDRIKDDIEWSAIFYEIFIKLQYEKKLPILIGIDDELDLIISKIMRSEED